MNLIKMAALGITTAIIFSGCSDYQLAGKRQNIIVDKISRDTFTVDFCGNAYMSQQDVEKYALQRAAKTTLDEGYSYFVVLEKRDDSEICAFVSKEDRYAAQTDLKTKDAEAPEISRFVKPNVTLKIKCFSKRQTLPEGAVDADNFLKENFPGLKK